MKARPDPEEEIRQIKSVLEGIERLRRLGVEGWLDWIERGIEQEEGPAAAAEFRANRELYHERAVETFRSFREVKRRFRRKLQELGFQEPKHPPSHYDNRIEQRRWPGGPVCPRCGKDARKFAWKGKPRYECRTCKYPFGLLTATPFHGFRMTPEQCFRAVHLVLTGDGCSTPRTLQELVKLGISPAAADRIHRKILSSQNHPFLRRLLA